MAKQGKQSFKISEIINLNIQERSFHLSKKQLSQSSFRSGFAASLSEHQRLCGEAAVSPAQEGLAICVTQVYIKGEETES